MYDNDEDDAPEGAEKLNYITRQPYSGQNQTALLNAKDKNGYNSDFWLTFLQAKGAGLKVKKGSHGTTIIKVVKGEQKQKDEQTGKDEVIKRSGLRYYTVFNLDQT